jgi:hypothetical protein
LLIPSDLSLEKLHYALQAAMGWDGGHLHQFTAGGAYYGSRDPDFGLDDVEDEKKYRIAQLLPREKSSLIIQNPEHPENEEMLDWLGGEFDPEEFDIEEVNNHLKMMSG